MTETYDVCVVGGGMAGICAAIASARNGARTVLVHDRPVLGGNASSEVRMWICGAHGPNNKETGLLEEIQLENCRRNSGLDYSIWDSVLYEKVAFCPQLTAHLNCTVHDVRTEGRRLTEVSAWQLTTYQRRTIRATHFIDCSGDSILGLLSGAKLRRGRESSEAFGEDIAPPRADLRTMGNTIVLQLRETDRPQPFTPPDWAYTFDDATHLPHRLGGGRGDNFWWLELGGLRDTLADAEAIRHDLYRTVFGVWDYMKNRAPNRGRVENWLLHNVGTIAGKRESHRYIGPHTLTQSDIRAGGCFDDIVAYGGWSMDDHHPAGLYYPGSATLFHPAPSPYGIPYRCLYSVSFDNLLCAGRNLSATHVALSSTRVMATCALLGQAAGTAAALAVRHGCDPGTVGSRHLTDLQHTLMDDDCWLPGRARPVHPLTAAARLSGPELDLESLRNGHDRPLGDAPNGIRLEPGAAVEFRWDSPRFIGAVRLVGDSNLNDRKRMASTYRIHPPAIRPPAALPRDLRIEAETSGGSRETVYRGTDLCARLLLLPVRREVRSLRLVAERGWGDGPIGIYSVDTLPDYRPKTAPPPRTTWHEVMRTIPPEDLAAPKLEGVVRGSGRGA
ncbi:MAG: FAD-dependent oxidoreductase [Puniceicoccaceae bacterium]|nr:MAG: FAD-dependent oxidoreductase [Puniceicoccaceae bacterium]